MTGRLDDVGTGRQTAVMKEGLERLLATFERSGAVAWCLVVATDGETPFRTGHAFVTDGLTLLWGAIGVGAVEQGLVESAKRILRDGGPQFVEIDLPTPLDRGGTGIPGRMTLLIDPVLQGTDVRYYATLLRRLEEGRGGTEAIGLPSAREGALSGTRCLFDRAGRVVATRDTESGVDRLLEGWRAGFAQDRPYTASGVVYFPAPPRLRLIVFGAGPVAEETCRLASRVEFDVWIVDDDAERVTAAHYPDARERMIGPLPDVLTHLPIDQETCVIVVRRGYREDLSALRLLVHRPLAYLGMIGNQRKVRSVFEDLRAEGITEDRLLGIRAPLGIPIGSRTVPEIAISIVAELIATRSRMFGRLVGK